MAVTPVRTCRVCGSDLRLLAMFCGECGAATGGQEVGNPLLESATGAGDAVDGTLGEETVDRTDRTDSRNPSMPAMPKGRSSFVLRFSTGESVTVTRAGLVGRNPVPQPGEYFDDLVRIHDPAKSVSKTHLEIGIDDGHLWVNDRYSGNGTVVRRADGTAQRCEPGKRYRVARGERVEMGEQYLLVS